jgi:hypothetical protein
MRGGGTHPCLTHEDRRLLADVAEMPDGELVCHAGWETRAGKFDRYWEPTPEQIGRLASCGLLRVALCRNYGEFELRGASAAMAAVVGALDHSDVLLRVTERGREAIAA